jgi:hypothetical protein
VLSGVLKGLWGVVLLIWLCVGFDFNFQNNTSVFVLTTLGDLLFCWLLDCCVCLHLWFRRLLGVGVAVVYYEGVLLGVLERLWGVVLLIGFCVVFVISYNIDA